MKRTLAHVALAISGLFSYGLAAILASLVLWGLTGGDLGVLPYLTAMAGLMGWDASRIAKGDGLAVLIQHGIVAAGALLLMLNPGWLQWLA